MKSSSKSEELKKVFWCYRTGKYYKDNTMGCVNIYVAQCNHIFSEVSHANKGLCRDCCLFQKAEHLFVPFD